MVVTACVVQFRGVVERLGGDGVLVEGGVEREIGEGAFWRHDQAAVELLQVGALLEEGGDLRGGEVHEGVVHEYDGGSGESWS